MEFKDIIKKIIINRVKNIYVSKYPFKVKFVPLPTIVPIPPRLEP